MATPSAAQLRARAKFAAAARAGTLKRKPRAAAKKPRKANPVGVKKTTPKKNPIGVKKTTPRRVNPTPTYPYRVDVKTSADGLWKNLATFTKPKNAKEYANAYYKANPDCFVRVIQ